ncbi:hypothetical protein E2562_033899, partial [Oryza meyeriana var. granulata]
VHGDDGDKLATGKRSWAPGHKTTAMTNKRGGQAGRRGAHQWQATISGGTLASGFSHRATMAVTARWRRHGSRARRRH